MGNTIKAIVSAACHAHRRHGAGLHHRNVEGVDHLDAGELLSQDVKQSLYNEFIEFAKSIL